MNKLRLTLLSAVSAFGAIFAASAALPVLPIAAAVAVLSAVVYRSFVETNTSAALDFFSSCWSCQIFGGVTNGISATAAAAYANLGEFVALLAVILTPIYFAWILMGGYLTAKPETNMWKQTGRLGRHLVKLAFITILLMLPLPRMVSGLIVEPSFNAALSFQNVLSEALDPNDASLEACLVATAISEPVNPATPGIGGGAVGFAGQSGSVGVFSPTFRHKMLCSIAQLHMLSASGMTAGWLIFNSAFDAKHMYKINIKVADIPLFPNVGWILLGLMFMFVYAWMIVPIAMAFLEFIIKFAIDIIFLPMTLLGWLFANNGLWKVEDKDIMAIITDTIKTAVGVGMIAVFMTFALGMVGQLISGAGLNDLNASFRANEAAAIIGTDGLLAGKITTLAFFGIFIAMFLGGMTELIKKLVSDASLPDELLKNVQANTTALYNSIKKMIVKKKP